MQIRTEIHKYGCLTCHSSCIFSRSCANHTTAGDFRLEDGFTPDIEMDKSQPDRVVFICKTHDRPALSGDYVDILPDNYWDLGQGHWAIIGGTLTRTRRD